MRKIYAMGRPLRAFCLCLAVVPCAASALGDAPWSTDLWLDRGGFWTNRMAVAAKNISSRALEGYGVAVPLPESAGRDDLRVTDANGVLLSFMRRRDDVVMPVTVAPRKSSRYYVYWGNPSAMAIAYNGLPLADEAAARVSVETGAVETMSAERIGEDAPWMDGEWRYRVPVRIANFSDRPAGNAIFRFRLAEALRETPNPEWNFTFCGVRHKAEVNGSELAFRHELAARTVATFYLYVKEGRTSGAGGCGLGESVEAVLPNDTRIDDAPKFPKGADVRFAHVGDVENAPAPQQGGLAVAKADVAVLVFPDRAVKDERGGFGVKLARNECETLQLAVRCGRDCADLSCEPSLPANGKGEVLAVEPGWVECVFVDAPSTFYVHDAKPWMLMYPHTRHPATDGWSGWWPDPVNPGSKTAIKANSTKAFRLLVKTSPETAPGTYRGELVWKAGGIEIRRDPYAVRVWNFTLPEKRGFSATFDVRGLSTQKERDKVYERLREYGIDADQSCRTLAFARDANGRISCDFREFDRLTELFFGKWKFTDAYFPRNPFSVFGWSRKPSAFLGEKAYEDGETDRSRLRPAYKAAYQGALRLFWEHLKSRGWEKRFTLYVSDEPHLHRPEIASQLRAVCEMIHEVDPAIPTYASTWKWAEGLDSSIDVWGICASGRFPAEKIPQMKSKGNRFWFTTDAQFPLDSPYLASELLFPVIGYFHGVEKYECWNCINVPQEGVWKYGFGKFSPRFGIPGKKDRWVRVPAGDGVLLYPSRDGTAHGYVPTVRIDAVRDGLETYEYLRLLAGNGSAGAKALLSRYRELARVPNAGGQYSKLMMPNPFLPGILREAAGEYLDRAGENLAK